MKRWLFPLLPLLLLLFPRAAAAEPALQAGDRVVIWEPETCLALSVTRSGKYQAAVPVSPEGDALSGFGDTEIWTVSAGTEGWIFTNGDACLSMADSYSYLYLDEGHNQWTLEGSTLVNTERDMLLCLNRRREQWYTATAAADSSGYTQLCFYLLPRAEAPEETGPAGIRFGLLHGHSTLSDGADTPAAAYQAAKDAGLDFFALTDHSQAFDGQADAILTAAPGSESWNAGKAAAQAATDESFLGLFAFEMTWNQGQGHMTTYFTPGFLSRDQAGYPDYAQGMENYFSQLLLAEGSLSQFCHPGEDKENFKNFSRPTPALDQRITLIEVDGNENAYFAALDAGWHLAPTWGGETHSLGSQQGRTAILTEELTEEALAQAMAARRVYATGDRDLAIQFSLGAQPMGSILLRPESTVTFTAALSDPTDGAIGTVELLSEGGEVLDSRRVDAGTAALSFTVNANRDYYLLRITQPDGDWAMSAPIWLEDFTDLGIAEVESGTEVTRAGEPQVFRVRLYNDEQDALTVTDLTATVEGVSLTAPEMGQLAPYGKDSWEFSHLFTQDGVYEVTFTLTGSCCGEAVTDRQTLSVTVLPPELTETVLVEGSVQMDNATALAAAGELGIRIQSEAFSQEALESCRLLVISRPEADFSSEYTGLLQDFLERGGSLILCGTAVRQDPHSALRLNVLAEALGLTGRFLADTALDETNYVNSPDQLRTAVFADSPWLADVSAGQVFAQFSGCSLEPGQGQWLVKGLETAGSSVLLCAEETGWGGTVFFSGGCFFSDDHIAAPGGNAWALPSANQTLWETILGLTRTPQQSIPIGQLRRAEPGRVYLARGRITAGTANPNTTFPDTVYFQDETGGIQAAGYARHGLALGTQVEILGTLEAAGENPLLQILRLTVLEADTPIQPVPIDAAVTYDRNGGELLCTEGTVTAFTAQGSAVSRFTLENADGSQWEILVEPDIRSGSRGVNELTRLVREGNLLRAAGLLHRTGGTACLRLRDCDEVWLLSGEAADPVPKSAEDADTTTPTDPDTPGSGDGESPETEENPPTGDSIGLFLLAAVLSCLGLGLLKKCHLIWEW